MEIHNLLKQYREKAGLTQEQVAQALYVQRSAYTHYENGTRKVDAYTFYKLMDIFGMQLNIQEKKVMQWRLDYEQYSETDDKEPIVLVVYEHEDTYRVDGFSWDGKEKRDLLFTGSSDFEQGLWFEKEDIDGILQREWKDRYNVIDAEIVTLEDFTLPAVRERAKGTRFNQTLSITQIEWGIRRMVKEQFGLTIDYTFTMDVDDHYASCILGDNEETQQAIYEVFKVSNPKRMTEAGEDKHLLSDELEEFMYDSEPNFTDAVLGSLLGGKVIRYQMDNEYYDKITITCKV